MREERDRLFNCATWKERIEVADLSAWSRRHRLRRRVGNEISRPKILQSYTVAPHREQILWNSIRERGGNAYLVRVGWNLCTERVRDQRSTVHELPSPSSQRVGFGFGNGLKRHSQVIFGREEKIMSIRGATAFFCDGRLERKRGGSNAGPNKPG